MPASEHTLEQTSEGRSSSIVRRLYDPVDNASLAVFRIVFGCFMCWHVYKFVSRGWVQHFFIDPKFHLKFPGFAWIEPLPGDQMWYLFYVMGLAAVAITLGVFYRLATVTFFLGFTYVFLLEKTLYQNHYYLVALISGIMIVIPADRAFSLSALLQPSSRSDYCPRWSLWLVRFLIGVPYFYGGIAKINIDWLQAQPMLSWLPGNYHFPLIGPYVDQPWLAWVLSYGGLIFDLAVVPALLWKRTRILAFGTAICFHLCNSQWFNIGIFPWFMIGATTIFFEPDWPRRLLRIRWFQSRQQMFAAVPAWRQVLTATLLFGFVTWQLVMPFRHLLYPGYVSWTEEGHYFAWHMMLRRKLVGLRFYATDPHSGQTGVVQTREFLIPRQSQRLGNDPDMILQFVHFLRQEFTREGFEDIEIRVLAIASLNGRKPQLFFDQELDLAKIERSLDHYDWVADLTEPVPKESWDVPLLEWPQVLGLQPPKVARTTPFKEAVKNEQG